MTRDSAQKATAEAAKYRRRLRNAEQIVEAQNVVLAELQRTVIRGWLHGKLADPADFETFASIQRVIDPAGRVDRNRLALEVRDLLYRKPHLAAPGFDPAELTTGGVGLTTTGSDRGPRPAGTVEHLLRRTREQASGPA